MNIAYRLCHVNKGQDQTVLGPSAGSSTHAVAASRTLKSLLASCSIHGSSEGAAGAGFLAGVPVVAGMAIAFDVDDPGGDALGGGGTSAVAKRTDPRAARTASQHARRIVATSSGVKHVAVR